ncbi:MAG: Gfo/Idh/MocA family oxidoreductase [Actinomycetota bacterium]
MNTVEPVRWGILGTAGIAESAFLPALAEAGGGDALVVGSRDGAHAARWAAAHDVRAGIEGYRAVLDDPAIEVVYVPLPNGLHAEWTIAALAAGKAVFCEKPLCATSDETRKVLSAAADAPGPLWEAFVFPFHQQMERVRGLLADGAIGDVREVWSRFHFRLDDPADVRMLASLAGGSTQDVGCYPIRLARLLFDDEPDLGRTIAEAVWAGDVDIELWGALTFSEQRRLVLSCGFRSNEDTLTRVLGTEGEIRMTNPFHPDADDRLELWSDGAIVGSEPAVAGGERSFTSAIRHIHGVLRGLEEPRHLAIDEALGNAEAIASLLVASRS